MPPRHITVCNEAGGQVVCPGDPSSVLSLMKLLAPGDHEAVVEAMQWLLDGAIDRTQIIVGSQHLTFQPRDASGRYPYDNG